MGFRFQRSIKILPGVQLNLSKSGVGVSTGVRGLRAGVDAHGNKYCSASLPGTGVSYRKNLGSGMPSRGVMGVLIGIVLVVGLLACLVIGGIWLLRPATKAAPAATVSAEQRAIEAATDALIKGHEGMERGGISLDGDVTQSGDAHIVKLRYDGKQYVCNVGTSALCTPAEEQAPTKRRHSRRKSAKTE